MSKPISQSGGVLIIGPSESFLDQVALFLGKKELNLTNNPDLLVFSQEKTGIEEIRKLKEFFARKRWAEKGKRIVLVNFGKGLSIEAQNALLKTLEELKSGNYIFISVPSQETLLTTITSRCQIIHPQKSNSKKREKPLLDLKKLSELSTSDCFAKGIGKGIDLEEIQKTINHYQAQLTKENTDLQKVKGWLKLCLKAQKMLEANIRSETVVDWLLLNL